MPLCTGAFTQGCFYTQELLHTDARVYRHKDAFTQRCFYTGTLSHTSTCVLHGILLTQSSLCTQKFLQKYSYAEMVPIQEYTSTGACSFLHTDIFTERWFLHRLIFTERCFYMWVLLDLDTFRQRNSYMGEAGDTV